MDVSSATATWVGTLATAIGLGGLIAQGSAIQDRLDPFFSVRSPTHLGRWSRLQPPTSWWHLRRGPPAGPLIAASRNGGFCGQNEVFLSRRPTEAIGTASWTVILAVFHSHPGKVHKDTGNERVVIADEEKGPGTHVTTRQIKDKAPQFKPDQGWDQLPAQPLIKFGNSACTTMSRATYITLLTLANARSTMLHSGAAGYRAAFGSYNGQWNIQWPIGSQAFVKLTGWDTHAGSSDVYPPFFRRRVDKCIDMLAGIIDADGLKVGFPGRKDPGLYILEYQRNGFGGAHGSRHLYNIMGGQVHEVDFLFRRRLTNTDSYSFDNAGNGSGPSCYKCGSKILKNRSLISSDRDMQDEPLETLNNSPDLSEVVIRVPSLVKNEEALVRIPNQEEDIILEALDRLPWSPISWSMHRGMKDILLAYGKPRLAKVRLRLANQLRQAVIDKPYELVSKGWNEDFARNNMPNMVYATVISGSGDSGDLVRVLTDAALLLWDSSDKALDRTSFWANSGRRSSWDVYGDENLDADAVVALTKFIVLEWSQELDYQMYHELPMNILVA